MGQQGISAISPPPMMVQHHQQAWSAVHLAPWYQNGGNNFYQDQSYLGNNFYPYDGFNDYSYMYPQNYYYNMDIGGGVYNDYFPSAAGPYPWGDCVSGISGIIGVPVYAQGRNPIQHVQTQNPPSVHPRIPTAVQPFMPPVSPVQHLKLEPVPVRTDTSFPWEGKHSVHWCFIQITRAIDRYRDHTCLFIY